MYYFPDIMLLNGKPEDISTAAEAAKGNCDIIGPECAIPLLSLLANLQAIAAIGRNPI